MTILKKLMQPRTAEYVVKCVTFDTLLSQAKNICKYDKV